MRLKIRVTHLMQICTGLVAVTAVATACVMKTVTDVKKESQATYQVVVAQQKQVVDKNVQRLKMFYMSKDERVWGKLAEYEAEATVEAAREYKIDLSILVGVVTAESEGYPFAKSRTGAKGPAQIDFAAHKERFPQIQDECDKYDPSSNIRCSAELLRDYIKTYGLHGALQVYNLGDTAFKKGKRNPRYVRKVLKFAREYRHF